MKWIIIALIVLLAGCSKSSESVKAGALEPKEPSVGLSSDARENARIEVAEVRSENVEQTLDAPGKLTWNDDRTYSIGVVATGKVIHVYAKHGDLVKKEQVLAKMHTHDVHDTKAMLRTARAERDRATATLELARRNEDRMRRLYELKAVSQAQFEQAQNDRKTAETSLRKANADVDKEVQHLTETLEITAEDEESTSDKHDEDEELVPIKSSADGVIVDRKISPGTVVTLGQESFLIADPSSLWVIANFPESSLGLLRVGSTVEVEVRAFPGRKFPARITRLGEMLDKDTRTLLVRAELPSNGILKPEMLASVHLRISGIPALVIPESAIQTIDGKPTVFVESGGKFLPREVSATIQDGKAIVQSGLKQGERVATSGSYYLKGQLVRQNGN